MDPTKEEDTLLERTRTEAARIGSAYKYLKAADALNHWSKIVLPEIEAGRRKSMHIRHAIADLRHLLESAFYERVAENHRQQSLSQPEPPKGATERT